MSDENWDAIRSAAASAYVDQSWYTEKTIALFPVSQADGALLVACRPANLLSLLDDYDALAAECHRLSDELGETELRALKYIHQCNAHVDLYRELKADRDALAADNQRLREALEEIVKQYPSPNISHADYRVHACRHAETALAGSKGGE